MSGTPTATPEQIALIEKLYALLMPYASKQRERIKQQSGRFAHYTSAAAALSIINSKRFWLRSTTAMSDYSEVQHGQALLGHHPKFRPLLDAMNRIDNLGQQALEVYRQWQNDIQWQTYVASLSEHDPGEDHHGRLSMWRGFSRGTPARVALVFRLPLTTGFAESLRLMFTPVAYFTSADLENELNQVTKGIEENREFIAGADRQTVVGMSFIMLMTTVLCLKHEGFHEEREWRVIHTPKKISSTLVLPITEVVDGVPQIVYKVPLERGSTPDLAAFGLQDILDRVIIGPSQYPLVLYGAFVEALRNAGLSDPENRVVVSGIPIRT